MSFAIVTAAVAGYGLAALMAGGAIATTARSYTLNVDRSGKIGTTAAALTVNSKGFAVYELKGETTHHLICTGGCLSAWPIVVAPRNGKVTAAPGIKGKLGWISRTVNGHKMRQATLGGHPLYTFASDTQQGTATGNDVGGFEAILASGKAAPARPTGPSTTTTTTPTTPTYTYTTPTYTGVSPTSTTPTSTDTTPTSTSTTPTYTYTTPTYTYTTPTSTYTTPTSTSTTTTPGW